jgi:ABC-type branched-subunit amino acid transport system substrate-binding protein
MRSNVVGICTAALTVFAASGAFAGDKKYDPGASDTEIKIRQTMPYSGPASGYGTQGKAELAYWKMINSKGGINGRKITLLTMDDSYSRQKRSSKPASSSSRMRYLRTSDHWAPPPIPRSRSI